VSAQHRAPGLVALAGLWGALDVMYSLYLLASEPAGVLRTMADWLPHARQIVVLSSILGVFIGGGLFVGAFMTHRGSRRGLLVLVAAISIYMLSGLAHAAWGLTDHAGVSTTISLANGVDKGNAINTMIWSYFVAIGVVSLLVGGAFLYGIRRAWARFPEALEDDDAEVHPLPPPTPVQSMSVEIERLNDLRERGLLSDDEYRQAKARLLTGGAATTS
jgi:hypothetical protein